jgi:hypothetical protein
MGEKKLYRSRRPSAKWRKPSVPRPKRLDGRWKHISEIAGYLGQRIKISFNLLKDHDVPPEFVDALEQEFAVRITSPHECGIDGRDDRRLAQEAKKRRLIVLTRNHRDFFTGPLIPLETCPGIFAIGGSFDIPAIVANMGAVLRELGPHVHWDWWTRTKLKFGPVECNLRRHENGRLMRRRLTIDPRGRVWFLPLDD